MALIIQSTDNKNFFIRSLEVCFKWIPLYVFFIQVGSEMIL